MNLSGANLQDQDQDQLLSSLLNDIVCHKIWLTSHPKKHNLNTPKTIKFHGKTISFTRMLLPPDVLTSQWRSQSLCIPFEGEKWCMYWRIHNLFCVGTLFQEPFLYWWHVRRLVIAWQAGRMMPPAARRHLCRRQRDVRNVGEGRLDARRKSGNVTGRKTTGFGGSRWIMYDI